MREFTMDHNEAVRQKATERYLLNELAPEERDQFEEHLFDCQECALDVRAAAMFVEQSKAVLSEAPAPSPVSVPAQIPRPSPWLGWLRPAFGMPVFALLLTVVGYQNLVQVPHLQSAANQPRIGSWASVNVRTRGAAPAQVAIAPGEDFILLVNIPSDTAFSTYTLGLYNPAGKLQWSLKTLAASPDDTRSIFIPGSGLEQGTYQLAVTGVTATGQTKDFGSSPVELKIQQ
jgi:hypothetical protein